MLCVIRVLSSFLLMKIHLFSVIVKRNRESICSPLLESKRLRHISTHLGEYSTGHRSKQGMVSSLIMIIILVFLFSSNLIPSIYLQKLGTMDRPLKQLKPSLLMKDEVEVAEALFALARMIPSDINPKRTGDQKVHVAESETLPANKSSLPLEGSFPLNKPILIMPYLLLLDCCQEQLFSSHSFMHYFQVILQLSKRNAQFFRTLLQR